MWGRLARFVPSPLPPSLPPPLLLPLPSQVYDQYLNFISLEDDFFVLRNQMMEELSYYGDNANSLCMLQALSLPPPSLFLLPLSPSALNRPDAQDEDIQRVCDSVVECLFSVFVTSGRLSLPPSLHLSLSPAGTVPIIRCPRGNAAEMVAQTLDKKLRDNVRDPRNSMFTGDSTAIAQLRYTLKIPSVN